MERFGDVLFDLRWELLLWGPWAAVSLLFMAWFAFGRHHTWDAAPPRESAVNWTVPLVGFALMVLGGGIAQEVLAAISFPDTTSALTVEGISALISQLLAMGLPAMLFVLWATQIPPGNARSAGIVPGKPVREFLVGMLCFVLVTPAVMGVNTVMVLIGMLLGFKRPDVGHDMLALMQTAATWLELAPLLLSAVVLAPLFEEAIFRGLIQTPMVQYPALRRQRWIIILISAAIFTAVHSAIVWQVVPGLFLLGVTLAWLYERTGSLWPGFVVHLLFNLTNVVLALTLVESA